MTAAPPPSPAVPALLAFAVLVCALSCLGLVVMKGFYNKLHYLAPPAILSTAAVAAAVALQQGWGSGAVKAGLVLLVMVVGNPVITFASARAAYIRDQLPQTETSAGSETEPPQPERERDGAPSA